MSNLVQQVLLKNANLNRFATFRAGDTVSVSVKIKEGEKERIQIFKGVVLKIQGAGSNRAFTVRKISAGVGVERTFPFLSPTIDKVDVIARGKVRQGRILYVRELKGKAANIESELVSLRDQSKVQKVATGKVAAPEPTPAIES